VSDSHTPDPHAIKEDVRYPHAESAELARRCRALASLLDSQQWQRKSLADKAIADWQGIYRADFDQTRNNMKANAGTLVDNLRTLANDLDNSAKWARDEQAAREKAREDSKPVWEKVLDAINPF